MALQVLQEGFEEAVRAKLGVSIGELPDEAINTRLIAELGESQVLKRVPEWQQIADEGEKILLESAIISYICYLLAPSMTRRVNIEVSTMDVKWKKDKVNWNSLAELFLGDSDLQLLGIESVTVDVGGDSSLVDYSRNERTPIG